MKERLPVPCPLQSGESLPGLLSRAVVSNHYSSLGLLAWHFGMDHRRRGINRNDMRHLATGKVNTSRLAAFTEHEISDLEKAAINLGQPCPGGRYDEYVSIDRWRYCPACIKAKRPHQRLWMIPFVTACPEHECELIDACQHCNRPNAVTLPILPHCHGCQSFPEARTAHEHEIECAALFKKLIDQPDELKARLDRLMTAWYLSTSDSLRPHYRFSPQLATVIDMRDRVIRLWPAAKSATALTNAIETLVEDLLNRWPRLSGLPTQLLKRAREAGALLPPRDFVETRISLLSNDDPWWVPQHVAAAAAGVSAHIMKPLVDKRRIRSKLFTDVGDDGSKHKFRMVDLNHLHEIIDDLYSGATAVESKLRLTPITKVPLHEVLRDVKSGRMSVFRSSGRELSDLMVSYNETAAFTRRQRKPQDTMTAAEAATYLGTYHAVIADLVDRKILRPHRQSHSQRLLIEQASVFDFHEKYILVGALAKEHGLNQTNLAEKLAALGVHPASLEALVNIYRRADIEGFDFSAVESVSAYKTKSGRKSTVDICNVSCSRTKKLIKLVEEHGGATEFTRKFGGSAGNLSMMMRGKKPFGLLASKRMEKRCGLDEGTLER